MKILTVIGARPQFIKAAVVSLAIADTPGLTEHLLHTGQHYDERMSDIFFSEMGIPEPTYRLNVGGSSHGAMTGQMLAEIEQVLQRESYDCLLVYGDTNSTLAGALAAAKLHVPVAHVEAGLRSFNKAMPEEINRILTDHVSTTLFCPTDIAVENLSNEGLTGDHIHQVGDVMYDAAIRFGAHPSVAQAAILNDVGVWPSEYMLATIHRAENTDDPLRLANILNALNWAAERVKVVLPLHPRTVSKLPSDFQPHANLKIIEPVGYLNMLALERNAKAIATDSGGVQKEAYFQRVPCVTFRDQTEWVELVETGWNRLASPSVSEQLLVGIESALNEKGRDVPLYGGGDAAQKIARIFAN
ncbi:MAG: UDP-N-acetylglucosamine 2-epimerase (non-hydrolyzing) [Fimbriimonadaceae bacterium]